MNWLFSLKEIHPKLLYQNEENCDEVEYNVSVYIHAETMINIEEH